MFNVITSPLMLQKFHETVPQPFTSRPDAIPETFTPVIGTKDFGVKSDFVGELVDEAPESKTIGKLSESNVKLHFVFKVEAKMES